MVSRITGTEQQETVPDAVVRAADEVELIDVSPEQLHSRLVAGQVYRPEQVDAALGNYFRLGNLTALRELALLWVAGRVDEALARYRHTKQITDTWETRERVVVAVTGGPESLVLVRRASRIASRSSADLVVVHVLRGDGLATGRDHLPQVREIAANCGASVHTVVGDDVRSTLLDFARGINATQLVLGTSRRSRWRRLFDESIGSGVVQRSGSIDVHMVTHTGSSGGGAVAAPRPATRRVLAWAGAFVVPAAILGLTKALDPRWDVSSQGWFFLVGVLAVSLLGGVWPASVCALVSGLVLNFFLTPPVTSLTVADPQNLVSLLAMVAVAIAVSALVDLSTRRHREASRSARDAELLTLFARSALRTHNLDDLLDKVRDVYARDGVAFLDTGGADTFADSFPKVNTMMREAKADVLAFTAFPRGHWQKIWSNNPIERLNKEIKRRADVVEIFPNPAAFLRLATSVVIDQHDEWQVSRRYLSETSMAELRRVIS